MQMQGSFNANQYEPNQGLSGHPPAQKIPFTVTGTAIKENSAKDGGFFEVELTSPIGVMIARYNIWSKTPKAVEIAHGQLSALCRATGRYQIDWNNEGSTLKGGQGLMDIGYQKNEEPDPAFPDRKGYTELKKVYDMAGNEPGKSQAQAQTNPGQQAPMTQQPGGSWGNQTAPQGQQTAQQPQGWQGGQPQQGQSPAPANGQQGTTWVPGASGNAAGQSPPWGSRT